MRRLVRRLALALLLLVAAPLGVHSAVWWSQDHATSWSSADWSSTHTLPAPSARAPAMVRVYSARTGHWKGIFATHSWIVLKDEGAAAYERWDKVGWGAPVRRNLRAPDGRWHGNDPQVVFTAEGARARALIPRLRAAIAAYPYRRPGDYRVWPGPNSNTFVAAVLAAVPETGAALPPTAIGKDFPWDGRWLAATPSGAGVRLTLGGYLGLTVGWVEGVEINVLGAVLGLDLRRPALKLPGWGRLGLPAA